MKNYFVRRIFILPIKFYQKFISPAIGKNCIYIPTCSSYTIESIEKHGVIKGLILGISRLLRCNKYFLGGEDLVPDKFSFKQIKDQFTLFHR